MKENNIYNYHHFNLKNEILEIILFCNDMVQPNVIKFIQY